MARLVFALNVSLDGDTGHERFAPDAELFAHWTEMVRTVSGSLYGRRSYEVIRYWDDAQPGWTAAERAFALHWRRMPKWVVSRRLDAPGPKATLIRGDLARHVARLKAGTGGEIAVGGPVLAQALGDLGLIDEYRLYLHPCVTGGGQPFFAGPRPRLRLVAQDRIGPEVIRLCHVPA